MRKIFKSIKSFFTNISLLKKFNIVYTFILLIPILIIALISNIVFSRDIINKTITSSVQNLEVVSESINNLFVHVEYISQLIVADGYVQEYASVNMQQPDKTSVEYKYIITDYLNSIIQNRSTISSIVIYLNNDDIIGSSYVDNNKIRAYKDRLDYYREVANNMRGIRFIDTHVISYERYNTNLEENNFITIIRPIISIYDGSTRGVILINVNEMNISELFAKTSWDRQVGFYAVNTQSEIVSSLNKDDLYKNTADIYNIDFQDTYVDNSNILQIEGEEHLVISKRIDFVDWIVFGSIPLLELTRESNKITIIVYLVGLLTLLISLLVSFGFSNSFIRRIRSLSDSMQLAGEGDFENEVIIDSNDEIGSLSSNFNMMLSKISSLMEQVYEEQKKKREYELMMLQEQIKPHFLYNAFDNLYGLVQLERFDDFSKLIKSLGVFYRIGLSKGSMVISVKEELILVKNYLTIQNIRYDNKFDLELDVNESILEQKIVKMSIQPIIENSIYHGFREKDESCLISICGFINDDIVKLCITDNGKGFSLPNPNDLLLSNNNKPQNFGLISVHQRLIMQFGKEYGIELKNVASGGAEVIIKLPFTGEKE